MWKKAEGDIKMVTAAEVKQKAKEYGADLCGISPMSRFEGCPKQYDGRYIFPGAKSMIVLGFRIARGLFRGIEEGTYFSAYPSMGYAAMNQIYIPNVLHRLTSFLEDDGNESIPIMFFAGPSNNTVTGEFREGWSRNVAPDKPYPDIMLHFRMCAFMAGLGEFGWSKVFLTPEFGPRVRFAVILTDAELEADPIYEGHICDRCKLCARNCSGHAISMTESVKATCAGHEIEFGKLDEHACEKGLNGGLNGELDPFDGKYPNQFGYGRAIEGGAGCMRACFIHLEQRGKLLNKFHNKFRTETPWSIDRTKPYELSEDIVENYVKTGKIESFLEQIKYDEEQNYKTKKAEGADDAPGNGPTKAVSD